MPFRDLCNTSVRETASAWQLFRKDLDEVDKQCDEDAGHTVGLALGTLTKSGWC